MMRKKTARTRKKEKGPIERYLRNLTFKRPPIARLSAFYTFFPFIRKLIDMHLREPIINGLSSLIALLERPFTDLLDMLPDVFTEKKYAMNEKHKRDLAPIIKELNKIRETLQSLYDQIIAHIYKMLINREKSNVNFIDEFLMNDKNTFFDIKLSDLLTKPIYRSIIDILRNMEKEYYNIHAILNNIVKSLRYKFFGLRKITTGKNVFNTLLFVCDTILPYFEETKYSTVYALIKKCLPTFLTGVSTPAKWVLHVVDRVSDYLKTYDNWLSVFRSIVIIPKDIIGAVYNELKSQELLNERMNDDSHILQKSMSDDINLKQLNEETYKHIISVSFRQFPELKKAFLQMFEAEKYTVSVLNKTANDKDCKQPIHKPDKHEFKSVSFFKYSPLQILTAYLMPLHIHNKRYSKNEEYIMPILALTYHLQTLMIVVPFYNISLGEGEYDGSILNLIHSHKPIPFYQHTLEFEKMNDVIKEHCKQSNLSSDFNKDDEDKYKKEFGQELFDIEKYHKNVEDKKHDLKKYHKNVDYKKHDLKECVITMKKNLYRKYYTKKGYYNRKIMNNHYGKLAHDDYCDMVSALQDKYLPVETLQRIKRCKQSVNVNDRTTYYGTRKSKRLSTKLKKMVDKAMVDSGDDDSHNAEA